MSGRGGRDALLVYLLRPSTGKLNPSVVALSGRTITHGSSRERGLYKPWRLLLGESVAPPSETVLSVFPFHRLREVLEHHLLPGLPEPAFISYGPLSGLSASFAAGALDYLRDPWDQEELVCRVERVLSLDGPSDLEGRLAEIHLTHIEERLLRALRLGGASGVSREALCYLCYGTTVDPPGRKLDMAVSRLRIKLSGMPGAPKIRALRGNGYRLEQDPMPEAVDNL